MSSSSKPPNSSARTRSSTSLKRKSHTLAEPNDVGSTSQTPVTGQSWYGRTRTVTHHRDGSAQHERESSGDLVCYRKSIRGRATIVVRVHEVIRAGYLDGPEEAQGRVGTRSRTTREQLPAEEVELLGTRDYVLKLMWRDPNKKMEGEVLERLVGIYGVGRHMWHSDASKACNCGRVMDDSCGACLDRTPSRDQVLMTKNLTDIDIEIPEEKGGEETQYKEVETDKYSEAYAHWTPRIYCRLLMSTVGSPLRSAGSPRQPLQGVLDAILGYWRLMSKGLLHRDISDGNVLMLQEGQGYDKREWKIPRATTKSGGCEAEKPGSKRRKLDSGAVASSPSSGSNEGKGREEGTLGESSLSRAAGVNKGACQVIDLRTGTPTFMSIRVLRTKPGRRYEHHFMDDLESFFWLIFVCVIEHVDSSDAAEDALVLLGQLDRHKLSDIAAAKSGFLGRCAGKAKVMLRDLASCENSWATDPAIVPVVLKLGSYFNDVYNDDSLEECTPNEVFPMVVKVIMDALNS